MGSSMSDTDIINSLTPVLRHWTKMSGLNLEIVDQEVSVVSRDFSYNITEEVVDAFKTNDYDTALPRLFNSILKDIKDSEE